MDLVDHHYLSRARRLLLAENVLFFTLVLFCACFSCKASSRLSATRMNASKPSKHSPKSVSDLAGKAGRHR